MNRKDIEILAPDQGTAHLVANVDKLSSLGIHLKFKLERLIDTLLIPT